MKSIVILILGLYLTSLYAVSLDAYLSKANNNLINVKRDIFFKELDLDPNKLIAVEKDKSILRYQQSLGFDFVFAGHNAVEVIFTFNDECLKEIYISMYNLGDCGPWKAKKFRRIIKDVGNLLARISQDASPYSSSSRIDGAAVREYIWSNSSIDATLRCSGKGSENLEFITVIISQHKKRKDEGIARSIRISVDKKDLPKRVIKEADGTRWLHVPMVDQGSKGYCVPATFARILRYYNADVDMHIMAQLLSSNSPDAKGCYDVIHDNMDKFKIYSKILYRDKDLCSVSYVMSYVSIYNHYARKAKKPTLSKKDITPTDEKSPFELFIAKADKKLFIKCRNKKGLNAEMLMKLVKPYIDQGIPLVWGVPGHARIINGYRGNDTIIFTDSWGGGHENKPMDVREAVSLTCDLYLVRPK
ncbi:MAG: hypothetical protein IJS08_01240 [Victivallales bacterium]|nr:hypothetical protein [Victivallales bacterium]